MKVFWTPDASARGDFFTDTTVLALEKSWAPGGEYFHTRAATRKWDLECQYEQITYAEREQILRWLDWRSGGELIFDDRPYASYYVRPTKKIDFKDYLQSEMGAELYSGTFTITFTAYDPFAKLTWKQVDGDEKYADRALIETGLVDTDYSFVSLTNADTYAAIYNPGTEVGHSVIRFAGKTGSGDLTIYNSTTEEKCVLKGGLETESGDYYELDSKTGRVEKVSGNKRKVDFVFHDEGYITFKPHMPLVRNISIATTENTRDIESPDGLFTEDMVGQYIYLGEWKYISEVISSTQATINSPWPYTGVFNCHIATINYLTITKADDAEIEMLEIECKAEVR